MKLTYRGISYEYNPPEVESSNSDTVGKYRGLDVRFRNPKKLPVLQTNLDFKYRGATHLAARADEVQVTVPVSTHVVPELVPANPVKSSQPVVGTQDKARSLMMGHHRTVKQRQQSMLTRLAAEVGLTANVSKYWNHIQGKAHPSFVETYERSHATLS